MKSSDYAGIGWPAIFVVITGIYGYWAVQRELVSSRPSTADGQSVPDPVPPPGIRSFHSRMWQDPLSASYEHYRSLPKEQRQDESGRRTVLDVDVDKEMIKTVARDRYVAWTSSTPPKDQTVGDEAEKDRPKQREQDRSMQHFFRNLVAKDMGTLCLPVFLPGGPYAEDEEERMRIRYSVVTALAEAGYHLKLNRRMSYVTPKVYVRVMWGWQERELVVPVKLYRQDRPVAQDPSLAEVQPDSVKLANTTPGPEQATPLTKTQILVLWIDESELGERPLLATHRILNKLFATVAPEEQHKLKVSMLGPTSSDTLETMIGKAEDLQQRHPQTNAKTGPPSIETESFQHWFLSCYSKCDKDSDENTASNRPKNSVESIKPMEGFMPLLAGFAKEGIMALDKPRLFSPRATKMLRRTRSNPSSPESRDEETITDFPNQHFIGLHRCIGTDEALAKSVYNELKLRGVFPGHVVLITEHDTGYGRAIPETYENAFFSSYRDQDQEHQTEKCVREQFQGEIKFHTFAILRGIDGEIPGEDGSERGGSERSNNGSGTNLPGIIERSPSGRSQYDYVRRLAKRIEQQPEVRAIGILGSDVYDKLLVLRALKPQFPDCVFFTTDMDAIYSHSTERQHTRNLLIASHYSLSLSKDLQPRTAPFRDSYQTATFLATRLAVASGHPFVQQHPREIDKKWQAIFEKTQTGDLAEAFFQPRMMVVGKDRIHQLPNSWIAPNFWGLSDSAVDGTIQWRPTEVKNGRASHYLFVITVALLIAAICWLSLNRDRVIGSPLCKELRNSTVFYSLIILLSAGVLLAVIFYLRGRYSVERAPFLAGYSTWPTKFLYCVIGIASVLTCAYLIHHWCRKLVSLSEYNDWIGERSTHCFQTEHTVKIGLIALVMIYIAGLFTHPMPSTHFWLPGSVVLLSLAGIWIYWTNQVAGGASVVRTGEDTPPDHNLILGRDLRRSIGYAVLCMLAVTILAWIASWERSGSVQNRWFPAHLSRGLFSREGDRLANLFAFGTVGLLLSTLLYFHLWCREFARYVLRKPEGEDNGGLQTMDREFGGVGGGATLIAEAKNERDRLWTIGQLSGVTGRFGPAMLGSLFLLVIGFHPYFSPVAMPISLLVIATLFGVMFVVSTLSLRWHFHRERQKVLARLERKTLKYQQVEREELVASKSDALLAPRPAKRTSTDTPLHDRVNELMEVVRPYGDESTAAATLTTAVLQQKKEAGHPDVEHEVQIRRDQITQLSEGVFRSWSQSPMGWILGGGATIALIDLWIRAWTIGI